MQKCVKCTMYISKMYMKYTLDVVYYALLKFIVVYIVSVNIIIVYPCTLIQCTFSLIQCSLSSSLHKYKSQ